MRLIELLKTLYTYLIFLKIKREVAKQKKTWIDNQYIYFGIEGCAKFGSKIKQFFIRMKHKIFYDDIST